MRKIRFFQLVIALALVVAGWPHSVFAESPAGERQARKTICTGGDKDAQTIARMIVSNHITQDIERCFAKLSDKEKAQVFEQMALLRGISIEELNKEAESDMQFNNSVARQSVTINGISWRQPIERGYAWASEVASASMYWTSSTCDNDPSDMDYQFYFVFPTSVTNPDGLKSSGSGHLGVEAMLYWYQLNYGGITGEGNTSSRAVYVCLGDGGVNGAGGASVVQTYLRIAKAIQ